MPSGSAPALLVPEGLCGAVGCLRDLDALFTTIWASRPIPAPWGHHARRRARAHLVARRAASTAAGSTRRCRSACGARGGRARPRDRPRPRQRARRRRRHAEGRRDADTPFCVYSASKAVTAMVVHMLDERGAARHSTTGSPSTSPSTRATARARSRSRTCSPTAPACRSCRARRSTSTCSSDRELPGRDDLRRQAAVPRRASCSPTTRSRAASSSARSSSG